MSRLDRDLMEMDRIIENGKIKHMEAEEKHKEF